jgi:hypothetical protein
MEPSQFQSSSPLWPVMLWWEILAHQAHQTIWIFSLISTWVGHRTRRLSRLSVTNDNSVLKNVVRGGSKHLQVNKPPLHPSYCHLLSVIERKVLYVYLIVVPMVEIKRCQWRIQKFRKKGGGGAPKRGPNFKNSKNFTFWV